jgi:hypothetical protein
MTKHSEKTNPSNSTKPVLCAVKEGDIVRFPVGFSLAVKRVYADENGDLYIKQFIYGKIYPRYIYKTMEGYKWDTRLSIEMGFGLAKKKMNCSILRINCTKPLLYEGTVY